MQRTNAVTVLLLSLATAPYVVASSSPAVASHESRRERIVVEVLDSGLRPVQGAQVVLAPTDGTQATDCTTGGKGTCGLPWVRVDLTYDVRIHHPTLTLRPFEATFAISRDGRLGSWTLPAPPWSLVTLRARLLDADGLAIAGAKVTIGEAIAHVSPPYEAVSGDDGRFQFEGVPEGAYWLEANVEGLARSLTLVRAASDAPEHVIEIGPGATLRGVLPNVPILADAGVFRYGSSAYGDLESFEPTISLGANRPRAASGLIMDGEFVFESVPPGHWIVYFGQPSPGLGRLSARAKIEVRPDDRELWVDLATDPIRATAPIHGQIVDAETGEPLDGTSVYHRPYGGVTESDASGNFELSAAAVHPLEILVERDGYASSRIEIASEDAGAPLRVEMIRSPGIAYEIRWSDGSRVGSVNLSLEDETGVKGTFQPWASVRYWPGAPPGRFTLVVQHGYGTARVPVVIPGPPVVVTLVPVGAARIRVPDLEVELLERPAWLAGVRAVMTPIETESSAEPFETLEPYVVTDLAPGRWRIELYAPDGREWTTEVTIRARSWAEALFF